MQHRAHSGVLCGLISQITSYREERVKKFTEALEKRRHNPPQQTEAAQDTESKDMKHEGVNVETKEINANKSAEVCLCERDQSLCDSCERSYPEECEL